MHKRKGKGKGPTIRENFTRRLGVEMKKIVILFGLFIIIIFLIPAIFTKQKNVVINEEISSEKEHEQEEKTIEEVSLGEPYNYSNYSTIRLLHSKNGEIEELPIDEYLLGVVSAEMPASFEQEALNAQATVARTYTIYTIMHNQNKHEGADICDDSSCCQAWISKDDRMEKWEENLRVEYWNKIVKAIDITKGKVITYNGSPIDAFFHSNSGGTTEVPVNVWGGADFPYLQSVQTAGEDAYSQYSSRTELSKDEFINKVKAKHPNFEINFDNDDAIKILEYTDSKRVKTIKLGNIQISGVEMRTILGLKSANFVVKIENDKIVFEVVGYGHGVGMSQTGADSMAKQGANYEEIIKHFYTGVEIINS